MKIYIFKNSPEDLYNILFTIGTFVYGINTEGEHVSSYTEFNLL